MKKTFFKAMCLGLFVFGVINSQTINAQDKTHWQSVVDPDGTARVEFYKNAALQTNDYRFKSIVYSPTPIGVNPEELRWKKDYFWDKVSNDAYSTATNHVTSNYEFLWKSGGATRNIPWRGDLKNIHQQLAANSIRVSMTSRFLPVTSVVAGSNTPTVYLSSIEPDISKWNTPWGSTLIKHQDFLDECYKNGIYVFVDLPLDKHHYYSTLFNSNDPGIQLTLKWENMIYKEVVRELKDHPADH
jgi:hypothetical protein